MKTTVNRKLSMLANLKDSSLFNVSKVDNKLLYSSDSTSALSLLSLLDKKTMPFRKNVTRFTISEDKRKLTLYNDLTEGRTSISIV